MRVLGVVAALFIGTGLFALACGGDDDGGNAAGPDGGNTSSSGGNSGTSSSGGDGDGGVKPPAPRWSLLLSELRLAQHIAISKDAIFIGAASKSTSPYEWIIEKRSLADGALVPAFGNGGVVTIPLTKEVGGLLNVTVDGDDLYVSYPVDNVFGADDDRIEKRSTTTGATVWSHPVRCAGVSPAFDAQSLYFGCFGLIERRAKSDGARVPGFGDGGLIDEVVVTQNNSIAGFVRDGDTFLHYGQVSTGQPTGYRSSVRQRDPNTGAGGWSFGSSVVISSINSGASDGTSLYVTGEYQGDWTVEKHVLSDGGIVSDFGDAGYVNGGQEGHEQKLALRAGTVYVASYSFAPGQTFWWVGAMDAKTGAAVPTFGVGGSLSVNPTTAVDSFHRVLDMDADDDSLYLLGRVLIGDAGTPDYAGVRLERRDRATGSL